MINVIECAKMGIRVTPKGVLTKYTGSGNEYLLIPEGIVMIDSGAFSLLGIVGGAVENIFCPSTLKEIGRGAFMNGGLSLIELNNGIERIGEIAFSQNNLLQIVLPDSIKEVKEGAFEMNGNLSVIKLSSQMKIIPERMCQLCSLKGIVIPNGVEIIGKEAFAYNDMSVVVIPSSVKRIERKAFKGALWSKKGLKDVVSVYYMGTEKQWKKIKIKSGNKEIKKNVKFVDSIPSELLFDSELRK